MTLANTRMPEHDARASFAGDARAMPTNVQTYERKLLTDVRSFSCSYLQNKTYVSNAREPRTGSRYAKVVA